MINPYQAPPPPVPGSCEEELADNQDVNRFPVSPHQFEIKLTLTLMLGAIVLISFLVTYSQRIISWFF